MSNSMFSDRDNNDLNQYVNLSMGGIDPANLSASGGSGFGLDSGYMFGNENGFNTFTNSTPNDSVQPSALMSPQMFNVDNYSNNDMMNSTAMGANDSSSFNMNGGGFNHDASSNNGASPAAMNSHIMQQQQRQSRASVSTPVPASPYSNVPQKRPHDSPYAQNQRPAPLPQQLLQEAQSSSPQIRSPAQFSQSSMQSVISPSQSHQQGLHAAQGNDFQYMYQQREDVQQSQMPVRSGSSTDNSANPDQFQIQQQIPTQGYGQQQQGQPKPQQNQQMQQMMNLNLAGHNFTASQKRLIHQKMATMNPQQQEAFMQRLVSAAPTASMQRQQQQQAPQLQSQQSQQQQPQLQQQQRFSMQQQMQMPQSQAQPQRAPSAGMHQMPSTPNMAMTQQQRPQPPNRPPSQQQGLPAQQNNHQAGAPMGAASTRADLFLKSIVEFMQRRGTPITGNPIVGGKQLHLYLFYGTVMKAGGSQKVSHNDLWKSIALSLGFNPTQNPEVVAELRNCYNTLLLPFEEAMANSQQLRARMARQQQQAQVPQQAPQPQNPQQYGMNSNAPVSQGQPGIVSPTTQQPTSVASRQASVSATVPKSRSATPSQIPSPTNRLSGATAAQINRRPSQSSVTAPQAKQGAAAKAETPKGLVFLPKTSDGKYAPRKRHVEQHGATDIRQTLAIGNELENMLLGFPQLIDLGTVDLSALIMALQSRQCGEVRQALDKLTVLSGNPNVNLSVSEAPGLLSAISDAGNNTIETLFEKNIGHIVTKPTKEYTVNELERNVKVENTIEDIFNKFDKTGKHDDISFKVFTRTGIPVGDDKLYDELSGEIPEDMSVSKSPNSIFLQSHPNQDSDEPFDFLNYQIMCKQCTEELTDLERVEIGFWEKGAVDRLICVTTLLRNLSFADTNRPGMVHDATTMKFLWTLVYELGNNYGEKLVRNGKRRLDLIKDLLTIFSNLALLISLENASQALQLLLLCLSFSPVSNPFTVSSKSPLTFGQYDPSIHRYLPLAIDIMAKILPRDPPNRQILESIMLGTCTEPEYLKLFKRYLNGRDPFPYEIMTRMFGICIGTVPRSDFRVIPHSLDLRRPLLHESLMVADIICSMIPSDEKLTKPHSGTPSEENSEEKEEDMHMEEEPVREKTPNTVEKDSLVTKIELCQKDCNLALNWLESSDGFGPVLMRAAFALGAIVVSNPNHIPGRPEEVNPFARITQRSISILRTLCKRATEKSNQQLPAGVLPSIEGMLGAMLARGMDPFVLRQLCMFNDESFEHVKLSSEATQ